MSRPDALQRLRDAKTALVMESPFFGALALRLKLTESKRTRTAATDGQSLFYAPAYIDKQQHAQLVGLFAHEVLHPGLLHHTRRGDRDPMLWNVACDHGINLQLRKAGFELPEGAPCDPRFTGQSEEAIYDVLWREQQAERQQQKGEEEEDEGEPEPGEGEGEGEEEGQDGAGDEPEGEADDGGEGEGEDKGEGAPGASEAPGGSGEADEALADMPGAVFDSPDPVADAPDWTVAVKEAAMAAKRMGNLPGGIAVLVEEALRPRTDWKALLRRFLQQAAAADYSWRAPNRRYASQGIYLPEIRSEAMPAMVVIIDTSASTQGFQNAFLSECAAAAEQVQPECIHLLEVDCYLQRATRFERGEPLTIEGGLRGQGGTSFSPGFEWIEREGIQPACVVYLTDGEGLFPEEPDYPVLWMMSTDTVAPWGETVRIEHGD